jgi:hypothetical protein
LQLLSDAAERLWYRLLTSVDDFGRLEADPEVVFTTCFQRVPKGWNQDKVRTCLNEMATKSLPGDRPLISLYRVGVKTFLQVISSPIHIYKRAKCSKYPDPNNTPLNQHVTEILPHAPADVRTCTPILSVPESRIPNPESRIPSFHLRPKVRRRSHAFRSTGRPIQRGMGNELRKVRRKPSFSSCPSRIRSLR